MKKNDMQQGLLGLKDNLDRMLSLRKTKQCTLRLNSSNKCNAHGMSADQGGGENIGLIFNGFIASQG